ncbi:MAG: toll/interleukin-1 receptor domain-containing protein [Planctomycetaceae bacterium]|nr:toll/interleukin-1 receptor domain-containing protein [Planctomycetaceae bacterium]
MPRIFVSHAAKDAKLVESFVDLLQLGVNVHPDDVFCSSLPGMNIPSGVAFANHIKSQIASPEIVLLLISPEFLKSQFCNNEVGASWALSLPIYPFLVPPVGYGDVRGVLDGVQVSKLDDKEKLNDLRDDLTEKLNLRAFRTSHWERKRDRFLSILSSGVVDEEGSSPVNAAASRTQVISSTGAWLKLGDDIYESKSFRRHGNNSVKIIIESRCPEVDADLSRLRPKEQGFSLAMLPFAYKNEGGFLNIKEITSASEGDHTVWDIDCQINKAESSFWTEATHNFDGKHLTPDDIAELKAGRVLINDPPPPKRRNHGFGHDQMESLIGGATNQGIRTDECVVANVVKRHGGEESLIRARLESVFILKAAAIVESIVKLILCAKDDGIEVEFEGRRPQRYQNEEAEIIRVAGRCRLEES